MASRRKNLAAVLSTIIISILLLGLQAWRSGTWFNNERLVVWVFDIGQGDAIFIDGPSKQVLIDGGGNDLVLEKLSAVLPPWDRSIDMALATHPHLDHIGGLNAVLEGYAVDELVDDGLDYGTPSAIALEDARDDEIVAVKGMKWDLGNGAMLEVVHPQHVLSGSFADDANDGSIVLLLTYGDTTMLLTGDAGVEQETVFDDALPHIDVLKVGHHGSGTSTGDELLTKITPDFSIISVGEHNDYGHPSPFVIDRLQTVGSQIFRTDEDGDVRVTSTGGEPSIDVFDL